MLRGEALYLRCDRVEERLLTASLEEDFYCDLAFILED